jgi:hypothetical protein
LDHFVSHYSGRCLPNSGCPAKHGSLDDDSKRWLDDKHPLDKKKIDHLRQLIERMKADVRKYVHGYNTCAVERAHSERTVHTSKRIEYWTNWEGKCRLVQLLHNDRTRTTGEGLLQRLGWQVREGVVTQLNKVDRDKTKHRVIKTAPSYNARQQTIRMEKKLREETDSDLIALEEKRRQKTRDKARHYYSVRKQLLYEAEEKKRDDGGPRGKEEEKKGGEVDAVVVKKKRGRPRKGQMEAEKDADKENVGPLLSSCPSPSEETKRKRVDAPGAIGGSERPVLMPMNGTVGNGQVLHPAMHGLVQW